jgi:hypothetical protein
MILPIIGSVPSPLSSLLPMAVVADQLSLRD